jgi:hypothetical protein
MDTDSIYYVVEVSPDNPLPPITKSDEKELGMWCVNIMILLNLFVQSKIIWLQKLKKEK